MPKSNIEKQLEKLKKENKRQQAEDKKQAIKACFLKNKEYKIGK